MCDPMSLVLGGLSAAASLASNSVQANAVKKQENLNNQWMAMQQQARRQEEARQEQLRQQAEGARSATVQDMSAPNQEAAQGAEQARLQEKLGGNEPPPGEGASAQQTGAVPAGKAMGGQEFAADMGARVSKATADARSRIRALAQVQSFGGTQGGLQTRNALELNQGEQGINLANNLRQGSLSAFSAVQNIEPVKLNPVSNPWGGIASALGGMVGKFGKA